MHEKKQRWLIGLCLVALYFIWGATFLAMKIAIDSLPPFLMAALRFLGAGGLLYGLLRLRGEAAPTRPQWLGAATVGTLLLACGNGGVAFAQQWVATGAAALMIATVPLWTVLFSGFWGMPPHRRERAGIVFGMLGVLILNLGNNLQASPLGATVLLLAAICWALGSIWGKHLSMPSGLMAPAAQMLAGGAVLVLASVASGERIAAAPTWKTLAALLYLIAFGSLIAYTAYLYLLKTVRPALATSYAFVNPLIAMLLGNALLHEHFGTYEFGAMVFILLGVLLVLPINFSFRTSVRDT